jgi:hypothetical protein
VRLLLLASLAGCGGDSTKPEPTDESDPPELASWLRNTTGATGYGGLPANVQRVRYSETAVYVNGSGIPAYTIGPWPGNPNTPSNQNFVFKIPRTPVENTGAKLETPLGPIGVWVNGVAIFNALDAFSYGNRNIWHQDAVVVEAASFDGCLGHPAPGGVYHHHQNPRCLHGPESAEHSQILGWAFDGYPVYGPFGYEDPSAAGAVARMTTSYRLRSITERTTLPDGTVLAPADHGPPVSETFPLGYYVEDYEYAPGLGDLDAENGRFTVTPEYPGGVYAYFVTTNAAGLSTYPYAVGPRYHGLAATENITTRGHVTITEPVTDYAP